MKVSVIVPVYNAEKYLAQCIESLINQTYSNIQIILVNDGSQDNSLAICKEFSKKDKRIIVIDQKNQGVSIARNNGIDVATGQYIGFVDSDDYVEPDMYKTLLDKIQLENSDCVTLINFTIRPAIEKIIHSKKPIDNLEAIGELFLLRFPSSMWAYLYKTNLVKEIKLSKDIHFFEDFEFNYNYLKACKKISVHQGKYYNYNINLESINHQNLNAKKLSCLNIYNKVKKDSLILDNKILSKKALFFRANFVLSMIISFSKSNSVDKYDFFILKKSNRKVFLKSLFTKYVPMKYKTVMLCFLINSMVTAKLIRYRGL